MPRLSIVIPALGAWEQLEATLVSVLANRPADAEIVVALGRGYDDPYGLEGEVRLLGLPPGATTIDAWNEAFASCRAPIVHLLACGAVVPEGWTDAVLIQFDDPRIAAVAPLVTSVDGKIVHTAGWQYSLGGVASNFASGQSIDSVREVQRRWVGPHGAAAFYRRSALASSRAAFDASLGEELAPLDLALRLRTAGYRAILEPQARVAVPDFSVGGAARNHLLNEKLFWRHAASDGTWQAAVAHFGAIAVEFARTFPQPRCVAQLWQGAHGLISFRRTLADELRLAPYTARQSEGGSPSRHFHPSHGPYVRPATRSANVTEGWPS